MTVKTRGVAFVITVYNKERYLEGTLKSILAQEGGFDREIIVVDDGSTDRSRKIAEGMIGGLANGKIIQQINSGPGVAQNTGVAAASMAVIKFVDGDDLLPPDCVLRMLPGLDLPNVAMVHGDGRLLNKLDDDISIDRLGRPPVFEVMEKTALLFH
ncbi:MAG: putative glycosyltransferase EpsH [Alphaproteobacteria bacterium MarineAlpha3_Bin3]|nr:MAG: putative glycosyltransferase EpsH [Alphaproteobacteria bacterium MarineAlpha3_Bin3]